MICLNVITLLIVLFINKNQMKIIHPLNSYLKSFISVCIVIIIIYFLKIIYTPCFAFVLEENIEDVNGIFFCYIDFLARIISFIPVIVCVILLRVRSYTKKCEVFMDYYNLCSSYYGDSFKKTFSNIMNIKIYTLLIVILFVLEIIYHAIIVFMIMKRIDFN